MHKASSIFYLIVLAMSLFVFACSGEKRKAGLEIAPAFSLTGLDSAAHTLDEYKAELVMLHFWADWCSHCRQEFAELQAAYDSLSGSGFEIVAINSGQTRDIVAGIRETYGLTFPMLMDPDTQATELYEVKGLPTTYFIDRDRRVLKRHIGWLKRSDIYDIFTAIQSEVN